MLVGQNRGVSAGLVGGRSRRVAPIRAAADYRKDTPVRPVEPPTPGPLQQLLQRTVPSALEAARSNSLKVMQGDVRPVRFGEASFKSTGRTVVITGGSQGIGRATALLFAKKGYNVVVAARNKERLDQVVADCAEVAGRPSAALAVRTDVTDEAAVQDLVNRTLAKFDSVDVVVNNAGVFAKGQLLDTPVAEARRLMEVNYLGALLVSQAFLEPLLKTGGRRGFLDPACLVMVNSFASKVPCKYMAAFTASKYALAGMTAALREETAGKPLHIAAVHPGMVKSNMMERSEFYGAASGEDRRQWTQALRSLPLTQTPEEVAGAIYGAVVGRQADVVVGVPFAAAAQAYQVVGFNPSAALPLVAN